MRTAIITGGSRGIGRAILEILTKDYDYIAICGRNASTLENVVHSANQNCIIRTFVGDVSSYEFVKTMVATVVQETGRIDVLINNAGISKVGLLMDMNPDEWNEIVNVNLTSIYNTCNAVIPHMIHEKNGKIMNISSVWGLVGASCEVAYSATKGAINSFTKALAKELAPSNISVNAVAFGAIDTEMNGHLSDEEKTELSEEIPFGRMATPIEAATCVQKLLEMPSYFTGEVVKFDGGWI